MSTARGDEETSETTSGKKLAWTDYKVLSVPKAAPHKCCLMQLQAITGTLMCAIIKCLICNHQDEK